MVISVVFMFILFGINIPEFTLKGYNMAFNIKGLTFTANLAEIVCKDLQGNLYQLKDLDPSKEYTVTVYSYDKEKDTTEFLREFCGKVQGVDKELAIQMRKQLNEEGHSSYTLLFKGSEWLGEPTMLAKEKGAKAPSTEEIPF